MAVSCMQQSPIGLKQHTVGAGAPALQKQGHALQVVLPREMSRGVSSRCRAAATVEGVLVCVVVWLACNTSFTARVFKFCTS